MTVENQFFRLRASGIEREREQDFTDLCFAMGAAGVSEELPFHQPDLVYEPDVVETPFLDASVFFTEAPDESVVLKLQGEFPEAKLHLASEENRDWLAEWKKGFKSFLFAGDFWIVPSWLTPPPEALKNPARILFVEPGMAFGTGTHETTRLAAGYVVEEMNRSGAKSVLDVGTGTGVLAIVARRLGATEVVGLDNDPEARRTARENLELNKEPTIEIPDLDVEQVTKTYDVVIANIIDGVLTMLQHELTRCLKPGGRMILSGVLQEREAKFYTDFAEATGLKMIKKTHEGEWSAAILEKQA